MKDYIERYNKPESKQTSKSLEICFSDMKCNMNCAYCYGDHKNRTFNNSRPLNKEALLKEFEKLTVPIADVHLWGGELTFNEKEFKDAVSFVKEALPGVPIRMVTNGLLLPQWTDFFIENEISLAISHDGPGQKYRGEDFLKKKEHNDAIKRLYDHKLFCKFKVVHHSKNWSTEAIINYFSKYSDLIERKVGCDIMLIYPNSLSGNSFLFKTEEDKQNLFNDTVWSVTNIVKNIKNRSYLSRYYQEFEVMRIIKLLNKFYFNAPTAHIPVCCGLDCVAFTSDGKKIPCHCFSEKSVIVQDIETDFSYIKENCYKCKYGYLCGGGCVAKTKEEFDLFCDYSRVYYSAIEQTILAIKDKNNFLEEIK